MSPERYQPTPDEMKEAEGSMTGEQMEMSNMRERAAHLAQELSEASISRGSTMMQEKQKMRQLVDLVKRIEGSEREGQIADEVIRFRAEGVRSKVWTNSSLDVFTVSKRVGDGEELEAIALIDSGDGGSMVMERMGHGKHLPFSEGPQGIGKDDPFHKNLSGWEADKEYEEDVASLADKHPRSDSFILANRFRELRTAARIIQCILGVAERK